MADLPPPLFDRDAVTVHRRSLPHWDLEGGIYFVTFRLDDSVPQEVIDTYRREQVSNKGDDRELVRLYCRTIDRTLDTGLGACSLAQPGIAQFVRDALLHFDGDRYRLYAYSIMPNHVHAVVRPEGRLLTEILHSWKSFTGTGINRILGRRGALWQHESFDHLIRHVGDLHKFCRYTHLNPERAGLTDWPWRFIAENLPTED